MGDGGAGGLRWGHSRERVLVGGNQKFGKRGAESARTYQPGRARGQEAGEDSGCRQVRGTHAAPTRLEQPGGRRPRSHSVSSQGGPQRPLPRPLPLDLLTLVHAPYAYPSRPEPGSPHKPTDQLPRPYVPGESAETPPSPPPDVTSGRAGRGGTPRDGGGAGLYLLPLEAVLHR